MPSFAKRCKKQFRRIFYSKVFGCVCFGDIKDQPRSSPILESMEVSQKLEVLLLKIIKHQLEGRQFHDQLNHTLSQISIILEQFGKSHDLQQKLSQHFPNDGFSKFTISVSKDSLIHCQMDVRKKSITVLNEGNVGRGNSVVELNTKEGGLIHPGKFSAILFTKLDNNKAVQYDPKLNTESCLRTNSKLIQTQLLNFPNFNIASFKSSMVNHIRNLKQDVITLRRLLYSLEFYPATCNLNPKDVSIAEPSVRFRKEQDVEFKFLEAKARAANFAKFYKLRKRVDKGKNRKGGENISKFGIKRCFV